MVDQGELGEAQAVEPVVYNPDPLWCSMVAMMCNWSVPR